MHARIDFDFVELRFASVLRLPRPQGERRTEPSSSLHRFFVYPGPRGSEEPLRCIPARSAQPKSIYSPWGWGKLIDFRAILFNIRNDSDTLKSVKMRKTVLLLIASILVLSSCSKDDFQNSFETPSRLLVSIRENGQLVTQFRYDNLNRLIQADRYLSDDQGIKSQYFEYDSENRLVKLSNGDYTEMYEYNGNGSLVKMNLHFKSEIDSYEWDQITTFQYSRGRISKGIIFSREDLETGSIYYKYDSRGNTTERTEYSGSSKKSLIISQFKYTYDEMINPDLTSVSPFRAISYPDIIQGNNPVYSYYYSAFMSSMPPEYEFTYDYDDTGLPIKGIREDLYRQGYQTIFEYEYGDKN
jgi:hypothetical protein